MFNLSEVRRYIVFITGGGVGALVNWAISFLLTSVAGQYYMVSYTVAQGANILVNFLWHRTITFRDGHRSFSRFWRFALLSVSTVCVSLALVYVLKEYVMDRLGEIVVAGYHVNYLGAIVAVTFLVSLINYTVSKVWVFGDAKLK